jgi:hypothetical protein
MGICQYNRHLNINTPCLYNLVSFQAMQSSHEIARIAFALNVFPLNLLLTQTRKFEPVRLDKVILGVDPINSLLHTGSASETLST